MGTIGVDDCFIGKKLGSGPQKSDGGGGECWWSGDENVFFSVADLRCFDENAAPLRLEGPAGDGDGLDGNAAGKSKFIDGLCTGGAAGLPGVLNATGGLAAVNDLVFISGSLRNDSSRFFSRCVDRSEFSAAAVVTATFGVTLKDRLVPP